jgi:translocation and assembly module TamA
LRPSRAGRSAAGWRRFSALASWLSLTLFLCGAARAADLPYTLAIAPTGEPRLDQAIEDTSQLVRFKDRAPVGPFALIARAEADAARIDRVLRSVGHYDAVIVVRIAGLASGDARLLPLLEGLPGEPPVPVEVEIDPGPVYRIGAVRLDGPVPDTARRAFDLAAGRPARAGDVLAAGQAVLGALQEDGFALARVPPPDAVVHHDTRTMDVLYVAEPGPRLALGEISVSGLERLQEDYIRRRLGVEPGEPSSPSRLERARQDLLVHGVLAWARLTPGDAPDDTGRLPLSLEVAERPPRVIRLGAAYASDEGATLSAAWIHRNLFGRAEELTLQGEVGRLTQNRRADLSHLARGSLRLPDLWLRDLDLKLDLASIGESLDAYDRDAVTAGVSLERRFAPGLYGSAGLGFEDAQITQDGGPQDYRLVSLPLRASYDNTDDPLDPTRGFRLVAEATPAQVLEGEGGGFVRGRAVASGYWMPPIEGWQGRGARSAASAGDEPDDGGDGLALSRTVLAARLALGNIQGAAVEDVPPDWRFYAGGGGSVRGFPFQSIGPRTASGQPAGGDGLLEASFELRLRFGEEWGAVVFVDAGAVSEEGIPGLRDLSVGAGIGLRYHTPIGPVRVDLAAPLTASAGDSPVQLYVAIGQAF